MPNTFGRSLLVGLLRQLKLSYNGQVPFNQSTLARYVLNEFRHNQLTDAQKCSREYEATHLAETYLEYLLNVKEQLVLTERYKPRKRTTKSAAHLVGLDLPQGPAPPNSA